MSFLDNDATVAGTSARLDSYVFSCELSSEVPFYTFQGDEDDDLEHILELRTICLGEGAKEENNVVEVISTNDKGKKLTVPVANLHISCLPMVSLGEFELMAPVTLHLRSGSGPVIVSGLHLVVSENDEESEVSDEDEESEEEMPSIKPAKKKQDL